MEIFDNAMSQNKFVEQDRLLSANSLRPYLPNMGAQLPALVDSQKEQRISLRERNSLQSTFDMKSDLNDLKKLTLELMNQDIKEEKEGLIQKYMGLRR